MFIVPFYLRFAFDAVAPHFGKFGEFFFERRPSVWSGLDVYRVFTDYFSLAIGSDNIAAAVFERFWRAADLSVEFFGADDYAAILWIE